MIPVELRFKRRSSSPVITDQDLDNFETIIGYALPQDYRQHMLLYNGGVERSGFSTVHKDYYGDGDGGISDFFPLKEDGDNLLEAYYDFLDRLDSGYIPIGYARGGGIVMSLNDATYGYTKVRYTEGTMLDLSPSFTDLINDMVQAEEQ